MKTKLIALLLAAAMGTSFTGIGTAATFENAVPMQQVNAVAQSTAVPYHCEAVYESMMALKEEYPDGMAWTNDNAYEWKGGIYGGGNGCAAFAFMLSDAAFGDLPASMTKTFHAENVRTGDILRMNYHSFIVLEVKEDHVVIAEGNINSSIMWGRTVSFADLSSERFEHHITRYPETFAFCKQELEIEGGAAAPANLMSRDALSLTWTSSDPLIASVDENGLVTGLRKGSAKITATSDSGESQSYTVIVTSDGIIETTPTTTTTETTTSTTETTSKTETTTSTTETTSKTETTTSTTETTSKTETTTSTTETTTVTETSTTETSTTTELGIYENLRYVKFNDHIEITGCDSQVEYVDIPSDIKGLPVTRIEKSAFQYLQNVKGITIPDSVTVIDDQAFYGSGLVTVTIPEGVTKIGEYAFAACENLQSICVPASVTDMGKGAFAYNEKLTSVELAEGLTEISDSMFLDSPNLHVILIPASVTAIGAEAFNGTSLEMVYYAGSEEMWQKIDIKDPNETLSFTEIQYDQTPITEPPTLGNLNGDDKVDASDAASILVAAAEVGAGNGSGLTEQQEEDADIDKNGEFNAADASIVLRYAAYVGSGGTGTLPQFLKGI